MKRVCAYVRVSTASQDTGSQLLPIKPTQILKGMPKTVKRFTFIRDAYFLAQVATEPLRPTCSQLTITRRLEQGENLSIHA